MKRTPAEADPADGQSCRVDVPPAPSIKMSSGRRAETSGRAGSRAHLHHFGCAVHEPHARQALCQELFFAQCDGHRQSPSPSYAGMIQVAHKNTESKEEDWSRQHIIRECVVGAPRVRHSACFLAKSWITGTAADSVFVILAFCAFGARAWLRPTTSCCIVASLA